MRLKRLSLQGYKTFATKTEFIFDDGITAIVGPNGSGKSNIADAVRWVLGEQSYSALRGKRTIDMIFAGSQSRARAGMAQSILTLDNSEGWLPIDFSEVEIGRRAYRSGENEYLLNGRKVRLRDLQELLATSGLAERTYTIIGQGLIDQALSLRAEERRALFEEAAGISHYKARRAETLRRLQETQHNLERVHDILSEIRPRLRSLERQASRARNYEQVEADLRHLLRIWYGYQWQQAKKELRRRRQTAADAESAWSETRRHLLQKQAAFDDFRRRAARQQEQVREKQKERESGRERLEQARRQVAVLSERRQLNHRQLQEIEQELPELEQQQAAARADLAEAMTSLEATQAKLAGYQDELRQFETTFKKRQQEIDRHRREVKALENEQRAAQNRLAQAEGQLAQLQERLQERQTAVSDDSEIKQAEKEIRRLEADVTSAQAAADGQREQRLEAQKQRGELARKLKALRQAHQEQNRQAGGLNDEATRLQARYDLLDQMRHKEITVADDIPLVGRFAGLVRIPARYQTSLEAALRTRLAALVTPDETALWQLIQSHNGAEALMAAAADHLQPPPSPPLPGHAAVVGWASQLVTHDEKVTPLVQLLLGRILIVNEAQAAYEIGRDLPAGSLAVTLDGFMVHAGGLVETPQSDPQSSILAREEAWRKAGADLARQKERLAEARTVAAGREAEIKQYQDEADRLNDAEGHLGHLEQEAGQHLSHVHRDLDRAQQRHAFLQRQHASNKAESERLAQRIKQMQASLSAFQAEVARLETAVGQARTDLQNLPIAEAEQQRHSLRQQLDSAQTIVAGRQAVVDSRRSTLNQIDGQLRRHRAQQQELQAQEKEMPLDQEQAKLQQLQQQTDQLAAAIDPLLARLDENQKQSHRLEEEIASRRRQVHKLETRYTQAKMNLNQFDVQLQGLRERLRSDLGLVRLDFDEDQEGQTPLPIAEVVDQLPRVSELPDDIEEAIERYRGQLHRMGGFNPEAPAEYEETQARHDFLSQQVEDLSQTEQQLRRIIAELDDLTSRSFAVTVTKVDAVFGAMFARLFGGGSAELILTDPDDLTISGVEIVARLPSRRQQGLAMLSGGERSLTAAALIFALLKVSPTPFAILDEVDAMLDEANIGRFRDVLVELSDQTQFIVVTHNRGTVQVARAVYGISMGSDSTSQVISIKPEEYVNAVREENN
jgi:chromosome segregation protein